MPDLTMPVVSGSFKLALTPAPTMQSKTLQTQNKFLDKNIVIEVAGATAAASPTLTVTPSTAGVSIGTVSSGLYPVSADITGQTSYGTAGWITTSGLGAVTDANVQIGTLEQSTLQNGTNTISSGTSITPNTTATQTITISAGYYHTDRTVVINGMNSGVSATATVTASKASTTPTLAHEGSSQTGKTQITVSPVTGTTGIDKYFIAVKATAPATDLSSGVTKTVNRAGYLGTNAQITATNIKTTSKDQLFYIPIDSAAVTVTAGGTASAPTAVSNSATTIINKTNLGLSAVSTTSNVSTDYFVAVDLTAPATTIAAGNFTKQITSNGYLDSDSQITVSGSLSANSATYYIPVTKGALKANAGSATATSSNVTIEGITTSAPGSGAFYLTIQGSGQAGVQTAGWVATSVTQNSSTATRYVQIKSATSTNNGASGTVTISEGYVPSGGMNVTVATGSIHTGTATLGRSTDTSVIIPSHGYLFLDAGYYPATEFSLDQLLGGAGDTATTTVNHILSGYAAYDVDGNLLSGAIATYNGLYTES